MKYDAYLENDDGESIKVLNQDITLDDGEWTFTKTLQEWIDLAVDEEKRAGYVEGIGYVKP